MTATKGPASQTAQQLRAVSRQLYAEPANNGQTFASSRPTVRPSDHFGSYDRIECNTAHLALLSGYPLCALQAMSPEQLAGVKDRYL